MFHIEETIVVEGKYDKERLKELTDAPIVCTGGFSLYKNKQLINFLKKAAEDKGIIIFTDSDSAGFRIRSYLKQCIGSNGKIINAYIPSVKGKERRKDIPGKEGLLGVEGIDTPTLKKILKTLSVKDAPYKNMQLINKTDFFNDGLSGRPDSAEKRKELAYLLDLPLRISANSMIDIINKTIGYEKYKQALEKLKSKKGCNNK